MKNCSLLVSAWIFGLAAAAPVAAEVVRDESLIRAAQVQGISMQMTPQQAFEHLQSLGYQAGNISRFADWRSAGIEFYKPGVAPPDESRVTFTRRPGMILWINEITNRVRGERIDVAAEIAAVRRHFRITGGETGASAGAGNNSGGNQNEGRHCRHNPNSGVGACAVSNGNREQPVGYVLQLSPANRTLSVGNPFAEGRGPDGP